MWHCSDITYEHSFKCMVYVLPSKVVTWGSPMTEQVPKRQKNSFFTFVQWERTLSKTVHVKEVSTGWFSGLNKVRLLPSPSSESCTANCNHAWESRSVKFKEAMWWSVHQKNLTPILEIEIFVNLLKTYMSLSLLCFCFCFFWGGGVLPLFVSLFFAQKKKAFEIWIWRLRVADIAAKLVELYCIFIFILEST
mgnify:CR=1 FL=1